MKVYRLTAQLLAPLAMKRERQSDRSETVRSLPGTTLRGALAKAYLEQGGKADETFHMLFLDETQCRFGPLDPGPHIFPLTVATCKGSPGEHGFVDQLWYRVAQHFAQGRLSASIHERFTRCKRCGADLKAHPGFYETQNGTIAEAAEERPQMAEEERRQIFAHVGIDRTTTTAADGMFYTLEAIVPSGEQHDLVGWVRLTEQAETVLRRLLEQQDGIVDLGHHRTHGYGRTRLQLDRAPLPSDGADQPERWQQWSDELIRFLAGLMSGSSQGGVVLSGQAPSLDPDRDFLFSISLPDGAILVDPLLRYTTDPAEMVTWLPPLPDPSRLFPISDRPACSLAGDAIIRCLCAVTGHQLARGWNAAHGLPRQDEWMVARGAVYVYWFRGTPSQRDELLRRLEELLATGIGLRRNEGYGRIRVSDPLHSQLTFQENAQ